MRFLAIVLGLLAFPAFAQTPGTINLQGPSTLPGAPQITPADINAAINAALAGKCDYPGCLTNLSSPPPIGGVAPNTGAFTALTGQSAVIGSPPGGFVGAGTLNASGLYVNGVAVVAGGGTGLPLTGGTVSGLTTFTGAGTGLAVTHDFTVGGNVAVTGALSGAGITALFASPPAIGSVAPGTGKFTTLNTSGAVLLGTGTPQGTPYQFQTAYNADPSVGPVDTRQNMFNTTLSYATTSTHIWENMNSFVQVNGPGTASGEINIAHTFLGISAGANVAVAEGYESSATNSGIIGSFANYLGLTNNFVGGTAGAIHGMNLYLNNLNATPGAIGEWAGINIGPMVGGGALPTFYSAIRIPDANAGIVTLGGILVGNLGNAVPGQVLIQGADNSDGTFTFQARDLAGANALLIANSGRVLFQASGITIQPITVGPNLFVQGTDNSSTTASFMIRNLATTVAFSVRNDGTLIDNGNVGVTCAPGAPTASFATSGGIVTHC